MWWPSYTPQEDETAPSRPPLPQLYDLTEKGPSIPPLPSERTIYPCSTRNLVHQLDKTKIHPELEDSRKGADSVSG